MTDTGDGRLIRVTDDGAVPLCACRVRGFAAFKRELASFAMIGDMLDRDKEIGVAIMHDTDVRDYPNLTAFLKIDRRLVTALARFKIESTRSQSARHVMIVDVLEQPPRLIMNRGATINGQHITDM